MHQNNEKRTLTAALSTTIPYTLSEMKPVLTRSNSENHNNVSKSPFKRDRSSFRATFRASFRRKTILKKTIQPFQTLKEDTIPDNGLLLSSYRVSPDIDERITERKRTKYRNPYKDEPEKEDGVQLGSRYDHMALIVKLNEKWFLCDCGWGGICFTGAVDMNRTTETSNLQVRCVPTLEKVLRLGFEKSVNLLVYIKMHLKSRI